MVSPVCRGNFRPLVLNFHRRRRRLRLIPIWQCARNIIASPCLQGNKDAQTLGRVSPIFPLSPIFRPLYNTLSVIQYVRMDGWMDGCKDARMYVFMDAWMHGCIDAWTDARMQGCMDAWMHVWKYAWMHGRTDAWMHEWMYPWVHECMNGCIHRWMNE